MSHFTVLVAGRAEDLDKILSPFCELDLSQEDMKNDSRAEFLEQMRVENLESEFEAWKKEHKYNAITQEGYHFDTAEEWMEDWHGYALDEDEGAYGYYHNPNAKWDWWTIGGRWSGLLLNKSGHQVNSCKIGEIDWQEMEEKSRINAEKAWEEGNKESSDATRYFQYGIEKGETKDAFIDRQVRFSTYAMVIDGEWIAKGEMGWFGMSNDDKEDAEWSKEIRRRLDALDPDTMVHVIDCHI